MNVPLVDLDTNRELQELLTRTVYFLTMEAKVLMGSRPAVTWVERLADVTADPKMTIGRFLGALDAAQQHAENQMDAWYSEMYNRPDMESVKAHRNAPWMPGHVEEGDRALRSYSTGRIDPVTHEPEQMLFMYTARRRAPGAPLEWAYVHPDNESKVREVVDDKGNSRLYIPWSYSGQYIYDPLQAVLPEAPPGYRAK